MPLPQTKNNKNQNSRFLVIAICLILLISFTLTSLVSYYLARQSMQSHIRTDSLPLTSENIYSHVQRDLIRPVLISSLMSKDTFVRDWVINGEKDKQLIISYLKVIQDQYQTVTSFFISDASHHYYHSTGVLKTIDRIDPKDQWYFDSTSSPEPYKINLDMDTADSTRTTFFVNHKILDYDDKLLGIIGVGLSSSLIHKRINEYQKLFNRTVYFIDQQGNVTLHGAGFTKANSIDQMQGMASIKQPLLNQSNGSFTYQHNGEEVFVNTRFIDELGWRIVVEEANKSQPEILRALWINLILSTLITLAIGWLISHLIQRYQSKLHKLLSNDHLTKLASRHGFEPVFHQMLKTAKRRKEPLSILLIDIDNFKKINDKMGHLEGDRVLKSTAQILQSSIRKCDAVCRWGGEEFIVSLAHCNITSAQTIAENIDKLVAEKLKAGKDNKHVITVSMGIAEFNLNETSDELFARADEALYRAKNSGRNKIIQAKSTIQSKETD